VAVDRLYTIELEPEVRDWLEALPAKHFLKIDEYVGLLAEFAASLGEPYARHLGGGVRELRARGGRRRFAKLSTDQRMTSSSGPSRKESSGHEPQSMDDPARAEACRRYERTGRGH
jgi:hypothetical protein